MKLLKAIVVTLVATAASVSSAATFDVSTPAEFQTALTTAQANGEPDAISVQAGTYVLNATLTYTAVATENFPLSIDGTDSTSVVLNGISQLPILRIDTTAVTDDGGVFVEILNMTFVNGNAAGTPADGGALAIIMDDSNQPAVFATLVALAGSEFYDNRADGNGGAVFIRSPAVEGIYLDDLTFDGNGAGGDGGAVHVAGRFLGTPMLFNNIDFFDNTAGGSGGGLYAGGYDVDTPSENRATTITLTDTTFYTNQSNGTAATDGGGGADLGASGNITVRITGFIDNRARTGGGLRIRPNFGPITMVNSGFTNNIATEDGGGFAASNSFAGITMTNNTIINNTATNRGGGVFFEFGGSSSVADFYNNILYANTAQQGAGADLYVNNNSPPDIAALVNVFNNDVTDIAVTPGPFSQGDNIDQDPLLVDLSIRPVPDPRLRPGSPAIDTGLNSAPSAPAFDFETDTRPRDGDGDGTATIDIGMDEFTGAIAQNVDLRVTKVADANPVVEGSDITYTVTVTNSGPGNASSVSMVDTLPGLLSYVSATASQGSCAEALGVITCDLAAIDAGLDATVTIVASTPDVPDTTVVTNTATVSAPEPDPNTANNTVALDTTIVPAGPVLADLAVTMEATGLPGAPEFDYAITVINNGPKDATGVVLTDTLPALIDFVSASATVGTCTHDTGVVTCNIGALANGASSDITIAVVGQTVDTATEVTNVVTVAATEQDPTPANNTATVTTTVVPPVASLSVSISSRPAQPVINEPITYEVDVSNVGMLLPPTAAAANVVATIDLPAGVTLVSVTPEQGTCSVDQDTVTCTIGDIAPSAAVNIEIVVTAPSVAGTISLSATVTSDTADVTLDDNVDSQSIVVIDVIDLVIEGTSEGTGSVGWIELLALFGAIGAAAELRLSNGLVSALVLVAALPIAAVLVAEDARAENDWYIGAAVGQADIDYKASDLTSDLASLGWTISNVTVDHEDTAWKIYGGWSMNQYFALELGWVDLGKIETRYSTTIPPNEIGNILADTASVHPLSGDGVTAAAVLRWPFSSSFAVHAKAGLFAWESDIDVRVVQGGTGQVLRDTSGTDGMYGLGLEWTFTDHWSLTAEWERYQLDDWVDTPSIGIRYAF